MAILSPSTCKNYSRVVIFKCTVTSLFEYLVNDARLRFFGGAMDLKKMTFVSNFGEKQYLHLMQMI